MASIQEMKDALATEQTRFAELAEKSISSIDTLLNVSTWTLSILAFVLGLVAIVGWTVIRNAALSTVRKMAKNHLDTYIKGDEYKALLEEKISDSIKARWQETLVLKSFTPAEHEGNNGQPFPAAPQTKGET